MVWPATARCQVPKATAYKWRVTGKARGGMRLAEWPRFLESEITALPETRRDPITKKGVNRG